MLAFVWNGLEEALVWLYILLSIVIVFLERRNPQAVWTWLLVLYFLPVVGIFLYIFIGQDYRKAKIFRGKEIEGAIHSAVRTQEEVIRMERFRPGDIRLQKFSDMILLNLKAAGAIYTADNRVEILADGTAKFGRLYKDILLAESYIHIQYYIIRNDVLWEYLEQALIQKAAEGVEVRILYDGMGCRAMPRKEWERLRKAGIQVAEFFPAVLKRLHLRINYRNHRKIVVIDGDTAYVGGFNVGREYVGLDEKFGYWRDTHLRIQGSAVLSLHIRFILDWNYASGQNLFLQDRYFREPDQDLTGEAGIQIVTSGPDSKEQNIRNTYLKMISMARKNLYIQTPYFIPDESVLDAIKIAVISGVDVRLMLPCKPDHPLVYWASYSYMGELMDAGAKCYVYQNGFLHAKSVMADGLVSSCGTANLDIRSFKLNFEVNAVIYSAQVTEELESLFRKDLEYCTQITPYIYDRRSWKIRVKEQFSRLFSSLL